MAFPRNPPPKNHLLVLGNRLAFRWEEERPGHRLPPIAGTPWWITLPGWSDGHGPFMKCGNSLHPPWFRWYLIYFREGTPKSSIFHRIFHYKPSILGTLIYGSLYVWVDAKNWTHGHCPKLHGIHLIVTVPEKMGGNPWFYGVTPIAGWLTKRGKITSRNG